MSAAGASAHTRTKGLHDRIDILGLNAVNDVVAAPRHEMAVLHDFHSGLAQSQLEFIHRVYIKVLSYKVLELFY